MSVIQILMLQVKRLIASFSQIAPSNKGNTRAGVRDRKRGSSIGAPWGSWKTPHCFETLFIRQNQPNYSTHWWACCVVEWFISHSPLRHVIIWLHISEIMAWNWDVNLTAFINYQTDRIGWYVNITQLGSSHWHFNHNDFHLVGNWLIFSHSNKPSM